MDLVQDRILIKFHGQGNVEKQIKIKDGMMDKQGRVL